MITNTVIKVLNREHGKEVIEFFKSQGINTRKYEGLSSEEEGHTAIYYGVDSVGYFNNFTLNTVKRCGYQIINLPIKSKTEHIQITNTEREINMNLVKTKEVTLNGTTREITLVVLVENGVVKSGYSVRLPEDKADAELAEKIATGRALKEKTNLTPDTELGKGLDKKYILHAIADNLFLQIERGVIKIKGVK